MTDDASGTTPRLSVERVTAGYGETTVLEDLSFDVGAGEVVGLIGRNGAGKTTTLRTIMGTVTPRAGRITYDGVSITDEGPESTARRGIALVPEERRIFEDLTVRENLRLAAFGGTGGDPDTAAIDEVLGTFENLRDRPDAPGKHLSGGEQQMLAIARAIVSDAELLLLDEPTEGLAPEIIEQVVTLIDDLRAHGLTILLVEQNVPVAVEICDFIYIIEDGRIVHADASDALAEDDDVLDRYVGISG